MQTAYVNGDYIPLDQARVPVLDRGFLFSDAVYEVIPVYAGQPFLLAGHLQRLHDSLAGIRLHNPKSDAQWRQLIAELIAANGSGDLSVYLQVTRGSQPQRGHRLPVNPQPNIIAFCQQRNAPEPAILNSGVTAITRTDDRWGNCAIKSTSLLANILATDDAFNAGAAEAILVRNGEVMEGASSNVFAVLEDTLVTPALRPAILAGITRGHVLELARADNINCSEATLTPGQLKSASEIWLTSSTREIYPVTQLDDAPVGSGKPGPVWARLHARMQNGSNG